MSNVHSRVKAAIDQINSVAIRVWVHADLDVTIASPAEFANAIGYPVERIAKTVILANQHANDAERLENPASNCCAICLPSLSRINLKSVAAACGWKRAQLAHREEVMAILDYPSGGVSPFGLGSIALIVDPTLYAYPTIIVGAGKVGVEIEIDPALLRNITSTISIQSYSSIW